MSVEKIEVVLQHDEALRGNVIIGKCGEDGRMFRISPKLTDRTPEYFRGLCRFDK
jgi:4-aminobutyrate aminotransferase-like enzyme